MRSGVARGSVRHEVATVSSRDATGPARFVGYGQAMLGFVARAVLVRMLGRRVLPLLMVVDALRLFRRSRATAFRPRRGARSRFRLRR
jgi:hypothetical protein